MIMIIVVVVSILIVYNVWHGYLRICTICSSFMTESLFFQSLKARPIFALHTEIHVTFWLFDKYVLDIIIYLSVNLSKVT